MSSDDLQLLRGAPKLTEAEFQTLTREEQEKYLAALRLENNIRSSKKLLTFEPMPKQRLFMTNPAVCRAIFGGNRSGKTFAGSIEFCMHVCGIYPAWFPKELRYDGPVKGRIIVTDYLKGAGEVVIPYLEEWIDPNLIARKTRNNQGITVKYVLKNGSQFDILTHEQDVNFFEGWKGHIAWFDEPPPRDRYVATKRGLVDYGGRHWLTLTPLTQPWIYDDIYTKADGKDIYVVTVDIRENTHLAEKDIKLFENSLTMDEKEARLHGKFLHLSGLVYKEFDPDVHIVSPIPIKKEWSRYCAIDPHERTPTAVIWVAVDEQENHWVYDELWLGDMDVTQISFAILAQEAELTPQVRLIDPHADKDNEFAGGFNFRKELMKNGVYCQRGNSDPLLGKSRIRQALMPKYSHIHKRLVPQMRIFSSCRQTIYEFQHYMWDEYRRNKDDYDLKEAVKKKNDHFMDALRYIYNYGPRYIKRDEDYQSEEKVEYKGEYAKTAVVVKKPKGYYDLIDHKIAEF